ncbi:MAG TPA: hypothetical protein VGK20_18335 [Candidatus Binatia bacterium]|jgi:hypothetical protein
MKSSQSLRAARSEVFPSPSTVLAGLSSAVFAESALAALVKRNRA